MHSLRFSVPPRELEMDSGGSLVVGFEYMTRGFREPESVAVSIIVVVVTVEVEAYGVAGGSATNE